MDCIKPFFLHQLQQLFQKDIGELIDLYLEDTTQKLTTLATTFEDKNLPSVIATARELRYHSLDVGAIQFSHCCLMLEIAAQERHFKKLLNLITFLKTVFVDVKSELEAYKQSRIY